MKKEITTIKLSKHTADLLNKLKIHPRQPYEEVILKLISESRKSTFDFSNIKQHSESVITTIKLSRNSAELLNKLKIHPRQSHEEVVLNLILTNEKGNKR